ncbi:MAG: hypothetical protein JWM00_647 [Candidatus Saccharibacteria bacterium]|nr:hypothetical protein [Candidatus Saccharibacteria bacterium]
MSYDDKVAVLAAKIKDDVFAELELQGLEFAQQVAGRHKLERDDKVNRWIYFLANKYYGSSDTFGIRRTLADIGPCEGTIHSALREAVWIVAKNFVRSKFEVLAEELNGSELVGAEVRMVPA